MGTLNFDGTDFSYRWWSGEQLRGTADCPISVDTETELLRLAWEPAEGEDPKTVPTDPLHIPRPALGMAFDGERLVLLHPTDFRAFLLKHKNQHLAGHNLAFDWWVMHRFGDALTQNCLWELGDNNRLHCTMVLDLLLQLATGKYRRAGNRKSDDEKLYPTNLGVLTEEWQCGELDKTDQYRLRFGELLGLTKEQMDAHPEAEGFYRYALGDVIATWRVFRKQYQRAKEIMVRSGWSTAKKPTYEIRPDAVAKWGVLSEAIQTKASITLAELSRTPIRIDQQKRKELEDKALQRYWTAVEALLSVCPDLYQRYEQNKRKTVPPELVGELILSEGTGLPKLDKEFLHNQLRVEADKLGIEVPLSTGKKKQVSESAEDWEKFSDRSLFLSAYCTQAEEVKFLSFLRGLQSKEGVIYSSYELLKRSGRTSASQHRTRKGRKVLPSLNVQQIPSEAKNADKNVRQLFLPPEGCKWVKIDYRAIEMATLAASCVARFGFSELREVIRENVHNNGPDAHQVTAAAVLGITVEEFLRLPKEQQDSVRQFSKQINFGLPGGMGVPKFVQTLASTGIHKTRQEVAAARKAWMARYPEVDNNHHLADHCRLAISWQTELPVRRIPELTFMQRRRFSEYLRGVVELTENEQDSFWGLVQSLAEVSKNDKLLEAALKKELTAEVRRLFEYRACSLTGRVRNNCGHSAAANSVFQGLASDGAKEAIWDAMRKGHRVLMFVHDELSFAVPERNCQQTVKKLEKIMVSRMEDVIGQGVPVAVESGISTCWKK